MILNLQNKVLEELNVPGGGFGNFAAYVVVAEHSHVMNRSRPTSKYECKPHVKVTNRHYILRCLALAVNVLSDLISWDNNLYMSAINCTYAIVEMWVEPTL